MKAPRKISHAARLLKKEPLLTVLLSLFLAIQLVAPRSLYQLLEYASIPTIAAITCFLIDSRILELSGLFTHIVDRLLQATRGSPRGSLIILVIVTAAAASLVMNDSAMFFAVPMAVALARAAGLDKPKTVAAVALAANIGSSLTPIGNPQNIYIWTQWRISFWDFTKGLAPHVAAWLAILVAYLALTVEGVAPSPGAPPRILVDRRKAVTGVAALIADIALVEEGLWPLALLLTLAAALIASRKTLLSIDYTLIATLAMMFIVFNSLTDLVNPPPIRSPILMIAVAAGLSQAISNVPATIVLARCTNDWLPLAIGVNLGGLGSVIGSLANFIGIRLSGVKVNDFHKHSLLLFALSLLATLEMYALPSI